MLLNFVKFEYFSWKGVICNCCFVSLAPLFLHRLAAQNGPYVPWLQPGACSLGRWTIVAQCSCLRDWIRGGHEIQAGSVWVHSWDGVNEHWKRELSFWIESNVDKDLGPPRASFPPEWRKALCGRETKANKQSETGRMSWNCEKEPSDIVKHLEQAVLQANSFLLA